MADRVERLTNLLALLLETPQPLSLVQIAGELAGQYPDSATARRATFERDKAALREIGVPIEQEIVGGADAGQTRYWIDRNRYELDGLELDDAAADRAATRRSTPSSTRAPPSLRSCRTRPSSRRSARRSRHASSSGSGTTISTASSTRGACSCGTATGT